MFRRPSKWLTDSQAATLNDENDQAPDLWYKFSTFHLINLAYLNIFSTLKNHKICMEMYKIDKLD